MPNSNSDESAVIGKVDARKGSEREISWGLDLEVVDWGDRGMVEVLVYERRRGCSWAPICDVEDEDADGDFCDSRSWESWFSPSSAIGDRVGDGGAGYGNIVFAGVEIVVPEA